MIGGNTTAILQIRTTSKNEIGESIKEWHDVLSIKKGFLDLSAGESRYTTYNAKVQESSHIFISDYVAIPKSIEINGKTYKVNAESTRLMVEGVAYDVMLIDDPMNLHEHLEIYLKYTGG